MRQADLNRAIAHAAGESIATIQRLGFLLADPLQTAAGCLSMAACWAKSCEC